MDFINFEKQKDQVAVYGGNYSEGLIEQPYVREVGEVITSGSFVNMNYVKQYGGYDERYFVYVSDYEFCWRARKNGYKIIINDTIKLTHQADNKECANELKSKSACYYAIRNNLILSREYRNIFPEDAKRRRRNGMKLWLRLALKPKVGTKEKISRGLIVCRAIFDYMKNKTGKM